MKASTSLPDVSYRRKTRRAGSTAARLLGTAFLMASCCLGPDAAAQVFDTTPARTPSQQPVRPVRTYNRTSARPPANNAPVGSTRSQRPYTAAPETPLERTAALYHEHIGQYLAGRLTAGLRLVNNTLKNTSRPADREGGLTFLGYINQLDQQDKSGLRVVAAYRFCPYFGVELSHDEVAARTRNYNNGLSDGILRLSGPVFTALIGYPVTEQIYPYIGIGYAPWSAEFEHDEWWLLDYDSPEAYEAHGSPKGVLYEDRSRCIEVGDDSAVFFTIGVAYRFHRHAQLDVMMRQIDLTSKACFYYDYSGERELQSEGEFTMKHTTFGITLSYVF